LVDFSIHYFGFFFNAGFYIVYSKLHLVPLILDDLQFIFAFLQFIRFFLELSLSLIDRIDNTFEFL